MRVAPDVDEVWQQSPSAPMAFICVSVYNMALGAVFIGGGWARIDGPSFSAVRDYGGPYTWGGLCLALGLVLPASAWISRRAVVRVFQGVSALHLLLAASFVAAVLNHGQPLPVGLHPPGLVGPPPGPPPGHPALTGIPTYLFTAAIQFACVRAYIRHSHRPNQESDAS